MEDSQVNLSSQDTDSLGGPREDSAGLADDFSSVQTFAHTTMLIGSDSLQFHGKILVNNAIHSEVSRLKRAKSEMQT